MIDLNSVIGHVADIAVLANDRVAPGAFKRNATSRGLLAGAYAVVSV